MKRSNRLVILVGLLLAVLAFVAIVILLNQREDAAPEAEATETVLVANEAIDIGEPVTPDKVREEEVDVDAVQPTPLRSTTQVSGQPALFAIAADAQVTAGAVGLDSEGEIIDISSRLNPGEKAVSFQVERVGGVDFLLTEGDVVDIIVTAEITVLQPTQDSAESANPDAPTRVEPVPGLEGVRTVKAILQNKRVLYVSDTRAEQQEPQDTNGDGVINDQDEQDAEAVIDSVIVVFAGNAQDAEVLRFAQRDGTENGSLSVVIRHAEDEEIEETAGITIDQLVEQFGLRIPGIVELLEEEPAP